MHIQELLAPARVVSGPEAASKKRVMELISEVFSEGNAGLGASDIFSSLLERERLGSTGLGRGVAIPHGRIRGMDRAAGAFIRLQKPIDFDAADQQPVDLLFALLVPEHFTDEHLQVLALLAEMFSDPELCQKLRGNADPGALYDLITNWQPQRSKARAGG